MGKLVLWGHNIDDYQEMFDLTAADLKGKVLEFGGGASAFNSELTQRGGHCISCDPLFALDRATLKSKSSLVFADMIDNLSREKYKYDFERYGDLDGLVDKRRAGMECFFNDYLEGKKQQRYIPAQQVKLPFEDFSFDLALTSHYLFADLDNQDSEFHIELILELARVAKEVRIFPLVGPSDKPSPCLGPVLMTLQAENYGVEIKSCNYHLQKQGNAMLRVWAQQCAVK